jgi:hypothetical protein
MINLPLTVREAMYLATRCDADMYDKIVNAFETALGVDNRCSMTITGGMDTNNRIYCIKAIRNTTGMGLKDSKDWTDVIVGKYDDSGRWLNGGQKNTMKLPTNEVAEKLLRELVGLGCEGYLS